MLHFAKGDAEQGCSLSPEHGSPSEHGNILGIPFDFVDYEGVLKTVETWRENKDRHFVTLTPPHTVLLCHRDAALRQATKRAALTLPDGVGIILAAKLLRYPNRGRVSGPTLMLRLCDWGRAAGLKHFFYGGAPGVADDLAENLAREYPGLDVVGVHCPPFRELTSAEDTEIVELINRTKPDIIWVGLGSPKQEKWMTDHVGKIEAAALIGVGAAFDFHAGHAPWAPGWMRKAGIEWAYRLTKEPRRMWRRNINSLVFIGKLMPQYLKHKRAR